jgi:hypothetical protein
MDAKCDFFLNLGPHEGAEDVDRFRTEAAPKLQAEDN